MSWPSVILRDVCDRVDYGYTASANTSDVGPKFLRITDIVPELIDWEAVPYCEIDGRKIAKYRLVEGDIIVARTGATTGYAKYLRSPPPSVFASYLVRFRPSKDVDGRFVGFIVQSQFYKDFIKQNVGGAAQPNANAQVLGSFPFRLPPLQVQRRVAAILSAYEDLIENNTRRIAILEEMARRLFEEWFVHFRFPGHESARFTEKKGRLIPKGWECKPLKVFVELAYGKALKKSERMPGPFPVYGSSGVVGTHDTSLVNGPGIIVGRKGNVGSVFWTDQDFWAIDTVYYVRTNLPLEYVFFNLQNQGFLNNDAAVPGLNREQAYSLPFIKPSDELLDQFSRNCGPLYDLVRVLGRKNQNLRAQRDRLLPKLIAGEIDVSGLTLPDEASSETA